MSDTLFLVSSDASDAEQLACSLRDRGWHVDTETKSCTNACYRIGQTRPFVVVISLEFEPDAACDLACTLSVAASTRDIPIVFVGGERSDMEAARKVAPRARFVDASHVAWEIKQLSLRS